MKDAGEVYGHVKQTFRLRAIVERRTGPPTNQTCPKDIQRGRSAVALAISNNCVPHKQVLVSRKLDDLAARC